MARWRCNKLCRLLTSGAIVLLVLALLMQPNFPKGPVRTHDDLADTSPSLPLVYWQNKVYRHRNGSCAPFPTLYDINFHNVYWQTLPVSEGTFHLYGAYLDDRNASRIGPAVRIIAVHDRVQPNITTYCQFWFQDRDRPVVVRNSEYRYMWCSKWGNYKNNLLQPYLMACILPEEVKHLVPASVSLVERPCDHAVTNLRVHYSRPTYPRKDFAVCVKGLDLHRIDWSVRIVEWIELLGLLGADKIYFYQFNVHPNISKVLRHYKDRGLVDVTPITLPGGQPNLPSLQHLYLRARKTRKRQNEVVQYNDCLYRHMHEYRYIVLLDVDEVIMPLIDGDWKRLMRRVLQMAAPPAGQLRRTSYHATNMYFLDTQHLSRWQTQAPRYMHILQHVYRSRNFTKPNQYVKAFHESGHVVMLHNHFPRACLSGPCVSYAITTEVAQLQHYRADCVESMKKREFASLRAEAVRDHAVWRWRSALVRRTDATLTHLGFFPDAA